MKPIFKVWATNRNIHLSFFDKYTLAQLNKIPEGFSNNLIWNLGHIIVMQQALVYKLSNLPMFVSDKLFETYKTGTKPTSQTTADEVAELRSLMTSLVRQTEKDFASSKFTSFTEKTTSTGFHLASIHEALEFNNYHEGLHLGFMMNIRKFV